MTDVSCLAGFAVLVNGGEDFSGIFNGNNYTVSNATIANASGSGLSLEFRVHIPRLAWG